MQVREDQMRQLDVAVWEKHVRTIVRQVRRDCGLPSDPRVETRVKRAVTLAEQLKLAVRSSVDLVAIWSAVSDEQAWVEISDSLHDYLKTADDNDVNEVTALAYVVEKQGIKVWG
jgi:hypothetical protein